MRLCSIASGSSGNCIYVGDDHTHLLVDTGISKKRIEEGLKELDIKGEELDGILITHEHIDHIQGLGVFSRRYEIPVYATRGTIEGIKSCRSLGSLPEGLLHPVEMDQGFALGGMEVRPFAISHDANEPSGFRIENGKKAVAVATDLGMYDGYTVENLKGLNGVVLEANHDIHMLEVGPYPYPLKRRVMGDKGHLSNEWSGKNINVNAIAPGYMATEMNTALMNDEGRNTEILSRIPAHRWGKPEDMKGLCIFLASDASDYMGGAVIPCDGGYLCK